MNTVQVKPGKPSKFYVNNKKISLNTAFGMYQNGVSFTNYLDTLPDELYSNITANISSEYGNTKI